MGGYLPTMFSVYWSIMRRYLKAHARALPLALVALLAFAAAFVWQGVLAGASDVLRVWFLDVGQGDAILIEAPNGNEVLIDGGKGPAVLEQLGRVLPFTDRSIDVVLATHPDMDHIGGLPAVFARYDVGMFIESGVRDDGADNTALHAAVEAEGLTPVLARRGMRFVLDKGVVLEVLFPDREVSEVDPNDGSIVARLTYGDTSFMFTGDSPVKMEHYLDGVYGPALASDVLKLGHHGSRTSTSDEWLGYVDPAYGVISVGCDNSYGHPHPEVLERLARFGVQALSTCARGTIEFTSDGATLTHT
jgi:competence protein ComEC